MISNPKDKYYDKIIEVPRTCIPWTKKENYELMIQLKNGLSLEDIARNNQRTILAVKYHIITNVLNIIKESNISLDTISKIINMPIDNLKKYIKNQEEENKKLYLKQIIKLELEILEKQKKLELELKELKIRKLELELKKLNFYKKKN
jgi:hypothetical protein